MLVLGKADCVVLPLATSLDTQRIRYASTLAGMDFSEEPSSEELLDLAVTLFWLFFLSDWADDCDVGGILAV